MKKIKFLAVLLFLAVNFTAYCQDSDDDNDNWPLQCMYTNIKTASGCDIKLINSLRNEKDISLTAGTFKVSVGASETIHYKHLKSVSFGLGNEGTFWDCLEEPVFFLGLNSGSEVKFRQGVKCKMFYAEIGAGSDVKINGKAEFGTLILYLNSGSEIKIFDLEADTLIIAGRGTGCEVKINGNVGTLINCKDYSAEIRGKFRTKRIITDWDECKSIGTQIKKLYEKEIKKL